MMSQALDRRLSWPERFSLRLHLIFCRGCANFGQHMKIVREACQRFGGELLGDGRE